MSNKCVSLMTQYVTVSTNVMRLCNSFVQTFPNHYDLLLLTYSMTQVWWVPVTTASHAVAAKSFFALKSPAKQLSDVSIVVAMTPNSERRHRKELLQINLDFYLLHHDTVQKNTHSGIQYGIQWKHGFDGFMRKLSVKHTQGIKQGCAVIGK